MPNSFHANCTSETYIVLGRSSKLTLEQLILNFFCSWNMTTSQGMILSCKIGLGVCVWWCTFRFIYINCLAYELEESYLGYPFARVTKLYIRFIDASLLTSRNLSGMKHIRFGSMVEKRSILWTTLLFKWSKWLVHLHKQRPPKLLPWCQHHLPLQHLQRLVLIFYSWGWLLWILVEDLEGIWEKICS